MWNACKSVPTLWVWAGWFQGVTCQANVPGSLCATCAVGACLLSPMSGVRGMSSLHLDYKMSSMHLDYKARECVHREQGPACQGHFCVLLWPLCFASAFAFCERCNLSCNEVCVLLSGPKRAMKGVPRYSADCCADLVVLNCILHCFLGQSE